MIAWDQSDFSDAAKSALADRVAKTRTLLRDSEGMVVGLSRDFRDLVVEESGLSDNQSLFIILRTPEPKSVRIGFSWSTRDPMVLDYVEGVEPVSEAAQMFVTLFLANLDERLGDENFGFPRELSSHKINWLRDD